MKGKELQLGMIIKHKGMRHIVDREITAIGRESYLYVPRFVQGGFEQSDTFNKLRDWEIHEHSINTSNNTTCKCSNPLNCS